MLGIENMRYFINEISQQQVGAVKTFVQPAQAMYDENLNAYVKLVLRRPMAKILVCRVDLISPRTD